MDVGARGAHDRHVQHHRHRAFDIVARRERRHRARRHAEQPRHVLGLAERDLLGADRRRQCLEIDLRMRLHREQPEATVLVLEEQVLRARVRGVQSLALLDREDGTGVSGGQPTAPSQQPVDGVREVYDTNVFGPIRVTQAFLPHLKSAAGANIVMVSSGLGSLGWLSDPANQFYGVNILGYNSSKTALNAVTVSLAKELAPLGIKVNAADPGYTATDFNGHSGYRTVEQAASGIVWLATLDSSGRAGYSSLIGSRYPGDRRSCASLEATTLWPTRPIPSAEAKPKAPSVASRPRGSVVAQDGWRRRQGYTLPVRASRRATPSL